MSGAPTSTSPGTAVFNQSVAILISQTKSAVMNCGGRALCGIKLPAAFTGTALSFEMSEAADGTFVPVKSTTSGSALSYTVAQGTYCAIDPKDFQGINFLKIVSGTTEIAARSLICSLKGF